MRKKKKRKQKNKVTLMSANLRLSVTCAVSNVGDVPAYTHTHARIHLNWFEVTEEIKCGRLEFIEQRLWQLDDIGLRF